MARLIVLVQLIGGASGMICMPYLMFIVSNDRKKDNSIIKQILIIYNNEY